MASVPANCTLKVNTSKMVIDYYKGEQKKFCWVTTLHCLKKIILSHRHGRYVYMGLVH